MLDKVWWLIVLMLGDVCLAGDKILLENRGQPEHTDYLAEPNTPFAEHADGTVSPTAKVEVGKTLTWIRGTTADLMMSTNGTPQLFSTATKQRLGGMVISDGNVLFDVKLQQKNGCFIYSTEDDVALNMEPRQDGDILCTTSRREKNPVRIGIVLLSEYAGNMQISVDNKNIRVAPFRTNEQGEVQRLYDGNGRHIVLFSANSTQAFNVDAPEGVNVLVVRYPNRKYGLELWLQPTKGNDAMQFSLTPGSMGGTERNRPEGYITKFAECDFWNHDRMRLPDSRGRNLLQNPSFEQGMAYLMFRPFLRGKLTQDLWREQPFQVSQDQAWHGKNCLRLQTDLPERNLESTITTHAVMVEPGKYVFSVYAKSDHPGHQQFEVAFSVPGAFFNPGAWPRKKFMLSDTWTRYEFPCEVKGKQMMIVALRGFSDGPALCYLDGMQLEKGEQASAFEPPLAEGVLTTSAADNVVEYGNKVNAKLSVHAASKTSGKALVRVRDFFDAIRYQEEFPFKTDGEGWCQLSLPLDHLPRGIFVLDVLYRLSDGRERYEFSRLAIMNFLDNTHRHKTLFGDTYAEPYTCQQIFPQVLDRYKKIGVGARSGFMNRQEFIVDEAEKYGVDNILCRVAHAYKENGERVVRFMDSIEWYAVPGLGREKATLVDDWRKESKHPTQEYLKRVEDAAAQIAKTSPGIKIWYPMCEPEGTLPELAHPDYASEQNFNDFVNLEVSVGKGIKKGNPEALLACSVASTISREDRLRYYDKLFTETTRKGLRYDCVGAHVYRKAPEYPGSLEEDLLRLFAVMKAHGYENTPVYCPEGMHWLPLKCEKSPFVSDYALDNEPVHQLLPYTYDMGYYEKLGAAMRARTWLVGLKLQDRVKHINASNYGCFEMDAKLTPYAFQKVPNTLGHLLGNATFYADLPLFPKTKCYLFEDENKCPVAALWSCAPEFDQGLQPSPEVLLQPDPGLELFDLMEAQHPLLPIAEGKFRLPLSPYPVFLRGQPNSVVAMATMLKNAEFRSRVKPSPELFTRLISPVKMELTLRNPFGQDMAGQLIHAGVSEGYRIPAGNEKKFSAELPLNLSDSRFTVLDTQIELRQTTPDNSLFRYDRSSSAILCRKINNNVTIDGSLDDWKGIPSIGVARRISGSVQADAILPADYSAIFRMAWNERGFYLAVEVIDDAPTYQTHLVKEGWKNDSLQVFIDSFADARNLGTASYSDDWSYGLYWKTALTESKAEPLAVYRHGVPDAQLTRGVEGAKADTMAENVTAVVKRTQRGYVYEAMFTADSLMPLLLRPGNSFGLCLLLNDYDAPDVSHGRRSLLTTASGSGMPNGNPQQWPLILLTE